MPISPCKSAGWELLADNEVDCQTPGGGPAIYEPRASPGAVGLPGQRPLSGPPGGSLLPTGLHGWVTGGTQDPRGVWLVGWDIVTQLFTSFSALFQLRNIKRSLAKRSIRTRWRARPCWRRRSSRRTTSPRCVWSTRPLPQSIALPGGHVGREI